MVVAIFAGIGAILGACVCCGRRKKGFEVSDFAAGYWKEDENPEWWWVCWMCYIFVCVCILICFKVPFQRSIVSSFNFYCCVDDCIQQLALNLYNNIYPNYDQHNSNYPKTNTSRTRQLIATISLSLFSLSFFSARHPNYISFKYSLTK